jgi:hypothetical protein
MFKAKIFSCKRPETSDATVTFCILTFSFTQAFAKKLTPLMVLQSLPFGLYSNATSFGIYDSASNNFSKVAVYRMRSCDYPTPQLARRRPGLFN